METNEPTIAQIHQLERCLWAQPHQDRVHGGQGPGGGGQLREVGWPSRGKSLHQGDWAQGCGTHSEAEAVQFHRGVRADGKAGRGVLEGQEAAGGARGDPTEAGHVVTTVHSSPRPVVD